MSYPKMLHRRVGTFRLVASAAAEAALNPRLWPASPLCWGLLTAPSVAQTTANALSARTLCPRARQLTAETVAGTDGRVRAPALGL